jgi:hypothetical protein
VLLNGKWDNGTKNTSVNQTGMIPGQSSSVSVYAINGTIMNPTPATLISIIPTGNPVTVKLIVTDDTYTSSSSPTMNYGKALSLLGQGGDKIYLKVNTSGIPQTAKVLNANLTTSISYSDGAGTLNVYPVTSPWAENTLTGATVITTGSSFATIAYPSCPNDCWHTDAGFTNTVQSWVNHSIANNGIVVYASAGNYVEINSRETNFIPYITVTYV